MRHAAGAIFEQLGDVRQARENLQWAAALEPTNPSYMSAFSDFVADGTPVLLSSDASAAPLRTQPPPPAAAATPSSAASTPDTSRIAIGIVAMTKQVHNQGPHSGT